MIKKKEFTFVCLLAGLLCVGLDSEYNSYQKIYPEERPIVNLPLELRQQNWLLHNSGSCVWATTVSLLRWQGQYELANRIRNTEGGGVYLGELFSDLDRAGVRYSSVCNGEEWFLEWACKTRRGAGIVVMGGQHMLALVEITDDMVCLMDNNQVDKYLWYPRNVIMSDWKSSGGYAFTPIYEPAAPLP